MVAIYDWFGYSMPIAERYLRIREAGFDGVLMWWSEGFGRGEAYRAAPPIARDAGLWIENIHAPIEGQNCLWADSLEGEAVADRYRQCISDCAAFEMQAVVIHLPDDAHPHSEIGLLRLMRIAEDAERHGINVALENLRNPVNLAYVLAHIDSARIGFCYDCGHHYSDQAAGDPLALYGDRLMAVHLHDIGGSHAQHQLPFDGPIDWPSTMRRIAETGYLGMTAIEAMNWDYQAWPAEEFLREARARAERLEALRIRP